MGTPTFCSVCGGKIQNGRIPPFCSKKCQATVEGYTPLYTKQLEKINNQVIGSAAFSTPLEPILQINAPRVGILSDVHCPLHCPKWTMKAIETFIHFGVQTVVLNGDFLDFTHHISAHSGSYYRRRGELEDDYKAAELLVKCLCEEFKEVYYLQGNHDSRMLRMLGGELTVQRIAKMIGDFPNFHITGRSFIHINDHATVFHPRQYSKARGKLTQEIAQRWQRNVAGGHEHHSAMSASADAKWQAVAIGTLVNTEKQDYVRMELTTHSDPMNGFAICFGNTFQVFDKFTPWEIYGLTGVK